MYVYICTLLGYFLATLSVVDAGEYCLTYDSSLLILSYTSYRYCTFGCCGYYTDQYCCSSIGPVIGIITGIGVFIAIVTVTACCCCRRQATPGMIVQSQQQTGQGGVTIVQSTSAMQPGIAYPTGYGYNGAGNQFPPNPQVYQPPPPYPGQQMEK